MKKYTIEELRKMDGKPVYVKVLDDTHVYKSGWSIIQAFENNVFASNGIHTILLSDFLGEWFEVYNEAPPVEIKPGRKVYNKLIRDNMQKLIEDDCKEATFCMVSGKDKTEALKNKLQEEVNEFLESGHITELADIVEVIHGIAENMGKTFQEVEELRIKKKEKRGGFSQGLFLKEIEFNGK